LFLHPADLAAQLLLLSKELVSLLREAALLVALPAQFLTRGSDLLLQRLNLLLDGRQILTNLVPRRVSWYGLSAGCGVACPGLVPHSWRPLCLSLSRFGHISPLIAGAFPDLPERLLGRLQAAAEGLLPLLQIANVGFDDLPPPSGLLLFLLLICGDVAFEFAEFPLGGFDLPLVSLEVLPQFPRSLAVLVLDPLQLPAGLLRLLLELPQLLGQIAGPLTGLLQPLCGIGGRPGRGTLADLHSRLRGGRGPVLPTQVGQLPVEIAQLFLHLVDAAKQTLLLLDRLSPDRWRLDGLLYARIQIVDRPLHAEDLLTQGPQFAPAGLGTLVRLAGLLAKLLVDLVGLLLQLAQHLNQGVSAPIILPPLHLGRFDPLCLLYRRGGRLGCLCECRAGSDSDRQKAHDEQPMDGRAGADACLRWRGVNSLSHLFLLSIDGWRTRRRSPNAVCCGGSARGSPRGPRPTSGSRITNAARRVGIPPHRPAARQDTSFCLRPPWAFSA
jgi:hypothetical protein